MSTTTTGKTTCPLCAAPGCSYGDDDRAFLLCPNPNCPPNARHGSISDWYVSGDEEILIRKALTRANGNVSHAADALGLSRGALYRRIEKYGL